MLGTVERATESRIGRRERLVAALSQFSFLLFIPVVNSSSLVTMSTRTQVLTSVILMAGTPLLLAALARSSSKSHLERHARNSFFAICLFGIAVASFLAFAWVADSVDVESASAAWGYVLFVTLAVGSLGGLAVWRFVEAVAAMIGNEPVVSWGRLNRRDVALTDTDGPTRPSRRN